MDEKFKCVRFARELHLALDDDPKESLIDVTMWAAATEKSPGLLFRLKLLWQIITQGRCFADKVVLRPAEAKKLGKMLSQLADVAKFRQDEIDRQKRKNPG